MKRKHLLLASLFLSGPSGAVGCYDVTSDPTIFLQGVGVDGVGAAGAGGGSTTTSTTLDPGCHPGGTPNPVRDDCGLFVSSSKGDDNGVGTKNKPYATIAKALASPESGPIYLCAETFSEAVHIKSGRTIYGGLDCTKDWTWSAATKSEVSPAAGEVPLVVDPQVGLVIEDVAMRAKDAVEAGGSSIAVIVTTGADVSFARCDVEAGVAKDGDPGEAFGVSASGGGIGNVGADACSDANVSGGLNVQNACDDADPNDNSISGLGGNGTEFSGGPGGPGLPDGAPNGGAGEGGMVCTAGTVGNDGAAGVAATGATGAGSITAQGYAGTAGNAGDKGKPGQGGGGGGGAKGGSGAMTCADAAKAGGASGGSGGSGGCGGLGGKGGEAGGASIGIVSIGAKLTFFDTSKVTAKAGGKGGAGGDGQIGGMGGLGGTGGSKGAASSLKDGCPGGSGGSGGAGGKGGGGLGGHSIGIAYTGDAPVSKGVKFAHGTPGDGGTGDGATGAGAKGVAADTQAF